MMEVISVKKLWYVPFVLMLMLSLVGCNTDNTSDNTSETSDNVNETTEVIEEDLEEVQEKSLRQDDNANNNNSTSDPQMQDETEGNTGDNSEQQPPVTNDVGGQGITDEGQNNDANNEAD